MTSCVIYTTVTQGYDWLKRPLLDQQLPMVCFSDDEISDPNWEIKPVKIIKDDAIRTARYYKLHPHELFPEYDWSIWVDGSLLITADLTMLLNEVRKQGSFGVYKHAKRDCLYQAAANCIDKNKDSPEIISQQMSQYQQNSYPEHYGLVASGVLVRNHHDEQVVKMMGDWWQEVSTHSRRDQLSFNYVCWKNDFSYYSIPGRIGDGRYFKRNPHKVISQ